MPIVLDDLPQLIRDHEEVVRGEAEQTGRLKEALRRLREELGVKSEEEAVRLVRRLLKKRDRIGDEYLAEYKRFKPAFRKYLQTVRENQE